MHLLFFMRNVGYVRNFEAVLRRLAAHGHMIEVVFDTRKVTAAEEPVIRHLEVITREAPNIRFEELPAAPPGGELFALAASHVRHGQDYLRYLDPVYAAATKLRQRAEERVPPGVKRWIDRLGKTAAGRRILNRLLDRMDRAIPAPDFVVDMISSKRPDLVMVTPLLGVGSQQADYIKVTRMLGIRSCLPVASWDNLTNKGLIRHQPNRVLVWNEAQRDEAMKLHSVPAASVVATGAHTYDHWFEWSPSKRRQAFCDAVGLRDDGPYLLFLGSSPFISPEEPTFVFKWLTAIRASTEQRLRDVGILIRPHPQNFRLWADADVSRFGNVAVWPRGGANPIADAAKSEYYDSIYHSRLVVGVNTSAMIEAGILGKAVFTVLSDDHADTQEGTLHFHHLADSEGGLLFAARSFDEHLGHLSEMLARPDTSAVRSQRFVRHFVRPFGDKEAGTDRFVKEVESQLSAAPPSPAGRGFLSRLSGLALSPLLIFLLPEHRRLKTEAEARAARALAKKSRPRQKRRAA